MRKRLIATLSSLGQIPHHLNLQLVDRLKFRVLYATEVKTYFSWRLVAREVEIYIRRTGSEQDHTLMDGIAMHVGSIVIHSFLITPRLSASNLTGILVPTPLLWFLCYNLDCPAQYVHSLTRQWAQRSYESPALCILSGEIVYCFTIRFEAPYCQYQWSNFIEVFKS
jgi:hypothetical protein